MKWKELLHGTFEYQYSVTENLIDMVSDSELDWKPQTGENWMTERQLLHHIHNSCGEPVKGFVTGDWGFPEDFDPSNLSPEDMLPTAEKLPSVGSVAEAKELLAKDKKLAFEMLEQCSEKRLETDLMSAPWDPRKLPLGHWLLEMANHLQQHKGQLFYYLKLQGKPVNTHHLYGG